MVDQWLEVEAQNYNPAIAPAVFHLVFAAWFGKIGDIRVVKSSLERLEKVLDIYERQLMKTRYLAGDFFSLADLSHLPYTHFLINDAGRVDLYIKRPCLLAWWTDISSRPTWLKHLSKAFPHIFYDPNE
ncbi:hypothetical protein Mapa_002533 [Marchantia paleacea]|nr:hypothetical protein Mapa_002533 [Marchantia paleacea]